MSSETGQVYVETRVAEKEAVSAIFTKNTEAILKVRTAEKKAILQTLKSKYEHAKPAWEARREALKGCEMPEFWGEAMKRQVILSRFMEVEDHEALSAVRDLWIDFKADPREFDLVLTFDENPYFSNKTLTKSFTLLKELPASAPADIKALKEVDCEWPIETSAVSIDWKSDEKNLVKLKPRVDPTTKEEFDEFEGVGSFFNFFTEATDMFDISEHLLELFNDAVDMYCALGGDDDDDEESDGDLNAEIDIEESEDDKPKKKRARKQ